MLPKPLEVVVLELSNLLILDLFGLWVEVDQLADAVEFVVPEYAHEHLIIFDRDLHAPALQFLFPNRADHLRLLLVDHLIEILLGQFALQLLGGSEGQQLPLVRNRNHSVFQVLNEV